MGVIDLTDSWFKGVKIWNLDEIAGNLFQRTMVMEINTIKMHGPLLYVFLKT